MSIKNIPELDASGLRKFAFTSATMVIVLFALLIPWLFNFSYPLWPWIGAGALTLWGVISPGTLNPVYKGWMRFGLIMNRITTPIILGIVFFFLFTPIALFMRLIGRDTLRLQLDKDAKTYRVPSTVQPNHKMEKPF